MPAPPDRVFGWFHLLQRSDVEWTSCEDSFYNCIAHVMGENDAWWWPNQGIGFYWPRTAPMESTLAAFQSAIGTKGYSPCDIGDLEDGFEKIAIFVDDHGIPTHAARQLTDGFWTSKLGACEDVRHVLRQLEGPDPAYGTVAAFMKRKRS